MAVCQFFLRGRCKFGDRCRDEHPGRDTSSGSRNPFAPLQNSSNTLENNKNRGTSTSKAAEYKLERSVITTDLSKERPLYTLSAYGPGKDAPRQIFGGYPREQSFEELRARHYELVAQGKQQLAVEEAQALLRNAEQQIQTTLNDVDGAIKYICDGETQHPNRIDICKARGAGVGQANAPLSNPSAFGRRSSTGTFGQTSTSSQGFSKPSGTSFGQTSAQPSVFGQPSGIGPGQQSTFGQPSAQRSIFGQPSGTSPGPGPGPGQPSAFGRPSGSGQTSSVWSQPGTTASATPTTTFGQPSGQNFQQQQPQNSVNTERPNPFAQFGQQSAPFQNASNAQSSSPAQNSVFGQPSGGTSTMPSQPAQSQFLGQPSQAQVNSSSSFTNSAKPVNSGVFGQPSSTAPGFFGRPTSQQPSNSSSTVAPPFHTPVAPTANATAPRRPSGQIASGIQAQRDGQGRLKKWNGKDVQYVDGHPCYRDSNNGDWRRIWFPDGPPSFNKVEDLPEDAYDEATKENYLYTKEQNKFKDGVMPFLPPRRDWCNWNL